MRFHGVSFIACSALVLSYLSARNVINQCWPSLWKEYVYFERCSPYRVKLFYPAILTILHIGLHEFSNPHFAKMVIALNTLLKVVLHR